ncbi:MAG: hypothetical protein QOE90_203 [Thermoplasmata archaeon]|nr:hypothetical protein [Thermoplasmata archaeon]
MDKITLDRAAFKALASDTRLDILKALDARQKTVTELARELDLNKATVFEHLEKLAEVGLIQKIEEDVERKWVYWQLSWKGRRLLHPEAITFSLLLSTALGTLLTGAAALWIWWKSAILPTSGAEGASQPTGAAAPRAFAAPAPEPPVAAAPAHDPTYLWVAAALGALLLVLILGAWWVKARARKLSAS